MAIFLLFLILIVLLAALGWVPGILRVILLFATVIGGSIAFVLWADSMSKETVTNIFIWVEATLLALITFLGFLKIRSRFISADKDCA